VIAVRVIYVLLSVYFGSMPCILDKVLGANRVLIGIPFIVMFAVQRGSSRERNIERRGVFGRVVAISERNKTLPISYVKSWSIVRIVDQKRRLTGTEIHRIRDFFSEHPDLGIPDKLDSFFHCVSHMADGVLTVDVTEISEIERSEVLRVGVSINHGTIFRRRLF
jgi:hypothetical protein